MGPPLFDRVRFSDDSYAAHYEPHDLEVRDWSSETAICERLKIHARGRRQDC